MKVVSINLSLAKEVEYQGKTVRTGIFKKPTTEPITVHQTQIQGDEQVDLVNHGGEHKAVYAFSANHYAFWQSHLNLDTLDYGRFGENLTITDLDESELCIGDRLSIGTTELEITQPRVPCFKLGIAFDNKKMPRMFVEHAETGIYFRVLKTGQIATGDQVSLTYREPSALPLKKLFRAYFDKSMASDEAIAIFQRADKISALSNEWREKVTSRLK